ncbi:hypothetical protein [Pseudonocardia thermophila]|uniref:hypothetical protein n=1 Tax=Pseudonocardia thermophila TaxID=1848 RepID=UPI00248E7397|nr:hypothetical protein [Pseudonocardia thermophila]
MAARPATRRWGAVLAAALALTACGAPEWTYVTNKEERTYAKVPTSWRDVSAEVPPTQGVFGLDPARLNWVQVFDADAAPTAEHAMGLAPPSAPAMVVVVFTLPEQQRGSVSLDFLRDLVFPVSERSRTLLAMQPVAGLDDFTLYADQTLTPGDGLRGVRSIFSYAINGGPPQVFDQTAYTNDDASKIYLIMLRCSIECFAERGAEIDSVASSFTVREN